MATTPSRADLMAVAFSSQQSSTSSSNGHRLSTFLSLAPTTSASYPSSPLIKSPAVQYPKQECASALAPENTTAVPAFPSAQEIDAELIKTRRSSSQGSEGKKRFLKLGPVHFGKGDGDSDWADDVIAE